MGDEGRRSKLLMDTWFLSEVMIPNHPTEIHLHGTVTLCVLNGSLCHLFSAAIMLKVEAQSQKEGGLTILFFSFHEISVISGLQADSFK